MMILMMILINNDDAHYCTPVEKSCISVTGLEVHTGASGLA